MDTIKIDIGVIGGSGLYEMAALKNIEKRALVTPFGDPSSEYVIGTVGKKTVAFLPRHSVGHKLLPCEVNYRANIYGFKMLGVERIISVSAVGSLKEEIAPVDIVIPHQFYDHTKKRESTFFGNGVVAHISFADPVCMNLAKILYDTAKEFKLNAHWGGTYINMEGPAFSTRCESNLYRQWGIDIIGMTNVAEAKLAREAEICYATLALVTDYDCWHPGHDDVTLDMVIQNLMQNADNAKKILQTCIPIMPEGRECECKDALKYAIVTDKKLIPEKTKKDLFPIIGKYVK